MADQEHLDHLLEGGDHWNQWRLHNPNLRPDLSRVKLPRIDLPYANLQGADLGGARLSKVNRLGALGLP
jgi:uncharacterized protein YjbI with pentapeptide repeats